MAVEFVVSFPDTIKAIQAEHIMIKAGLHAEVMLLPPAIRTGCGLCLRLPLPEKCTAQKLLQENDITVKQFYTRTVINGKSEYSVLKEKSDGE